MGDLWAGLFKMKPELLEDVSDEMEMNRQLMDGEQGASQQAADTLSAALSQNGKSRMLSRAAQEAVEAKENVGGIQAGSGDGELKKVPLKDQLFLDEKLSSDRRLREIAAWAGRMKVIVNRKQRLKHKDAISRNGIRQGNDIEQLLPMELGSYASPISKMDFLRRYAEGQIMK